MMKKIEASTLILRLVLGVTFFVHGLVKFQGGIENIVGWFDAIGLPGVLSIWCCIVRNGWRNCISGWFRKQNCICIICFTNDWSDM